MPIHYFFSLSLKLILINLFLILFHKGEINVERRLLRFIKYNKKTRMNKDNQTYLKDIKEYIGLIERKMLKQIHFNHYINKPKISFISPVYNKEKYLESLILSIQHQLIEEFEIIFIDDCSTDKSVNIINKFQEIDRRIKLIKNKINRGTLYSRIQGVLFSKGEYIMFVDSDDAVLKEGIYNAYNYIKKKKLSMIQFNTIFNRNNILSLNNRYYKYEIIIKQPLLSYIFFYNDTTKRADELNTALWDKLIDRKTSIKTVNFIGKEYYNEKIKIENDVILLFSLFRNAESYQYINETGYYYVRNHNDSITNTWKIPEIANHVVHGLFVNIKFLFEKTHNTYLEKSLCIFKLQQSFKRYIMCFVKAEKEFSFMKYVFKLLLDSPYFLYPDKAIILNIYSSISLLYKYK